MDNSARAVLMTWHRPPIADCAKPTRSRIGVRSMTIARPPDVVLGPAVWSGLRRSCLLAGVGSEFGVLVHEVFPESACFLGIGGGASFGVGLVLCCVGSFDVFGVRVIEHAFPADCLS
ncbi:hypothetical protein [Streptomyces sp. NPDC097981]|uniref:hypothetical protein n=1 Tax=Streptomyces sp. NPDC097981 TaxID=3155428 RepID=UPI00332B9D49